MIALLRVAFILCIVVTSTRSAYVCAPGANCNDRSPDAVNAEDKSVRGPSDDLKVLTGQIPSERQVALVPPVTCPDAFSGTCNRRSSNVVLDKRRPPSAAQKKRPLCHKGYSGCPTTWRNYGSVVITDWDCIDVQNNLESCGGCVHDDSPFGEKNVFGGRDCSAIPRVDSVRCQEGRCIIEQCRRGYVISRDGSRCV